MGTVINFKPSPVLQLSRGEPAKTAAIIKEILSYLLGQAEAAALPTTAHALALAIHCAGKEADDADREC